MEGRKHQRLVAEAGEWETQLPKRNADGNYPAREYLRISIARTILRRRRALGLTQVELARRACIRPETLNRIEQAKHAPSVPTVDKIERALNQAEAKDRKKG